MRDQLLAGAVALVLLTAACTAEGEPSTTAVSPDAANTPSVAVWSNPDDLADVEIAQDGRVWTAGPGGVTVWDPGSGSATTYTTEHGLGVNAVREVAVAPDGTVIAAHGYAYSDLWWGPDVAVLVDGRWTSYDLGPDDPAMWWVGVDDESRMLGASDLGTYEFVGGDWVEVDQAGVTMLPPWLAADPDGAVWAPFWNVGLVRLPDDMAEDWTGDDLAGTELHITSRYLAEYEPGVGPGGLTAVHELPELATVWGPVVTDDGTLYVRGGPGLASWDGDVWAMADHPELSAVDVRDVATQGEVVWVATDRGLAKLDAEEVAWLSSDPGLHNSVVHLLPTADGVVAVSQSAGFYAALAAVTKVTVASAQRLVDFRHGSGFEGDVVPNVVSHPDFGLVTVDEDGQLVAVESGEVVPDQQPLASAPQRLAVDGHGIVWAYAGDAIQYLADGVWREAVDLSQTPFYNVTALTGVPEGGVWLTTWDRDLRAVTQTGLELPNPALPLDGASALAVDGSDVLVGGSVDRHTAVAVWDGTAWTTHTLDESARFGGITAISRDSDGIIWAGNGTRGDGLLAITDDEWRVTRVGIPSPDVLALAFSGDALWVGTTGGLARLDSSKLEIARRGQLDAASEPRVTTTATTSAPTPSTVDTTTIVPPTAMGISDLASGLFCRDLAPLGYSYADAVAYWTREGRPDRMDADRNGIPCETVYPTDDVRGFWGDPLPTTTIPAGSAYVVTAPERSPKALPGSGGASGSGCRPGSDTLPDGIWYGYLTARGPDSVDFDLACLTADPTIDGGFRLENTNPKVRQVSVRPTAVVHHLTADWRYARTSYGDWFDMPFMIEGAVWLYVNGGVVTEIVEQFLA